MAKKEKARLYEIVDETFYPELQEYGITLGYVMQVNETAAVREFLARFPKVRRGSEVVAVDCETMGSEALKTGKKWIKENRQ